MTLGYLLVYGRNSSNAQPWYVASMIAPMALLIGLAVGRLAEGIRMERALASHTPWVLAGGVAISLALAAQPQWPHQVNAMGAGQWLREHPQERNAAAFNAGIVAYFRIAVPIAPLESENDFGGSHPGLYDFLGTDPVEAKEPE